MDKTLYLIRHGYSLHNQLFDEIGPEVFEDERVYDSPLIFGGQMQSIELGNTWIKKYDIDLVLVSPLSRTLETCMNIFGDMDVDIICLENLREYPIGQHTCNQRKSIDFLSNKYPKIKFNIQENEDTLWTPNNRESIEELNERINDIKGFIQKRDEKNIAIIGHASFIGQLKDNKINYREHGDEELKHCHPYIMNL